MPWTPGQSGNPKGPGPGPRIHHRNKEVFDEIKKRGHQDPLITLAELSAGSQDEGIRTSAASSLAPFMHPKLQALPTPRYIETPIEVPDLTTVEQATEFLGKITTLAAESKLDFQSASDLSALAKNFIDSKVASDLEARVAALELQGQGPEPGEPEFTT